MARSHFDGRVAIVTGAGRGLGRSYAILLAQLGARVVVNNRTAEKAYEVVAEIMRSGYTAVADAHDVYRDGDKVVRTALDHFGRLDIVINNAGQLRDRTFSKMTSEEWEDVINTHLHGTFRVTKAAWPTMVQQGYGRIVMVSSQSAVAGNIGQSNYSAAKGAVVSLAQTLALEGAKSGIVVNAVATAGLTRMTEQLGTHTNFPPERTALGMAYFCHEDCADSGGFWRVAGGTIHKFRWQASNPQTFDADSLDGDQASVRFTMLAASIHKAACFDEHPTYPQVTKHGQVPRLRQIGNSKL